MAKILNILEIFIILNLHFNYVEPSMNLALRKTTRQSSNWQRSSCLSGEAVDGDRNQRLDGRSCSHTAVNRKSAWWEVDLAVMSQIKRIDIYYRDELKTYADKQRLNGYSIRIKKSLDPSDPYVCYENPIDSLPRTLTPSHSCPSQGRYVKMYVERNSGVTYPNYDEKGAIINLCEFEVYGCKVGFYGNNNCNTSCATGCDSSGCDPEYGNCTCKDGWKGEKCTVPDCPDGQYGHPCQSCPSECMHDICDSTNGDCKSGCKPRQHGPKCDKQCPINCDNRTCHQDTGDCNGCIADYHSTYCDSKCPVGCKNAKCSQHSGDCSNGCDGYFTGKRCTECADGKHGEYCNKTCPLTCKDNVCYKNNGTCVKGCTHVNMTGSTCDGCKTGVYGENCTNMCPKQCNNSSCHKDSGHCVSCNQRFAGPTCTDCKPSYYGALCSQECPGNCTSNICGQNDGKCKGCNDGYYGEYCNKTCSCSTKECEQNDGVCTESAAVISSGPAIGAVVAVIVIVLFAVIVIVSVLLFRFFRRRRRHNHNDERGKLETKKPAERHRTGVNNPKHTRGTEYVNALAIMNNREQDGIASNENQMNRDGGNQNSQNIYMNDVSREVPVSELNELISRKTKNNEFDEEYNKLPKGCLLPHVIGKKQENMVKNRFKNTFPYDHSRVVLEQIDGRPNSDYINANYIDGTEVPKLYIATQGPKPNTLSDFWRMIWQEDVGKIVMLTNLVEKTMVKCDKYWPDYGKSKDVEQMRITSESEKEYSYFILRSFSLHNEKTNETRHIKQFHFTMWPDHGTPDPIQLMLFHRKVKNAETDLKGPCVVHCAAGIGRTGTFIALDTLHEYGERTGKIDIFEYVRRMRDCRMNMIQTLEQYIVLHEALLESFQYVGRAMTKEQFFEACNEIQNGKPKNETHTYKEYQTLTSLRPVYGNECYKGAMSKTNKRKIRNQKILAADKYRPYLTSHHSSRTNFINAVMLPSCTKRCGYIATHYPLKDTVEDLWCMIYDHDCKAMAVLNESGDKDGNLKWYPIDSDQISMESFVITKVTDPVIDNSVTRLHVNIKHKGSDEEKEVAIFIFRPWPIKQCVPSSTPDFLQFINKVDNCQKGGNGPVTVISSDGAQCIGIFCTVSNVIQNLKLEDEIDIFHTVRQLQIRRPQFFKNVEEYESCYTIVKTHLESTNVYANA